MRLSEMREELLEQHGGLRELAAGVVAADAQADSVAGLSVLMARLQRLLKALDAHNRLEEKLLGSLALEVEAWEALRAAQMDDMHRREHRAIEDAIGRIASAAVDDQRATARAVVAKILRHMAEEERLFLNAAVLRDDFGTAGQSDP